MRHRRPAQCRQVDPLQRADAHRGGAGGELSVLHHRAQHRRGRRARSAARQARGDRQVGSRSCRRRSTSSTSPGWCAAPPRAKGSATSSSPTSARSTRSRMSLRCFEDADITHVEGRVDPVADAETVETELMLADLESLERRVAPLAQAGQRRRQGGASRGCALMDSALGAAAATASRRRARAHRRRGGRRDPRACKLLTAKPVLYVCNVEEARRDRQRAFRGGRGDGRRPRAPAASSSRRRSRRRSPSSPTRSSTSFSRRLGLDEPGLDRLIRAGYELLGLHHLSSPPGRRRRAPGRSQRRPGRRRRRASSTPISSAASSAPRPSPTTTTSRSAAKSAAKEAGKARDEGKEYVVAGRRRDAVQVQRLKNRSGARAIFAPFSWFAAESGSFRAVSGVSRSSGRP